LPGMFHLLGRGIGGEQRLLCPLELVRVDLSGVLGDANAALEFVIASGLRQEFPLERRTLFDPGGLRVAQDFGTLHAGVAARG